MNARIRFEQDSLQHPSDSSSTTANANCWWRGGSAGAQAAHDRVRPAAANWREGPQASLLQGLHFRAALAVVLQTEAADCGLASGVWRLASGVWRLASLAMLPGYHGTSTDLVSLRRRHAISMSGITLANLVNIAAHEQVARRAVRLEPFELAGPKLPCILHRDLSHIVVLESVSGTSAVVIDLARGRRVMPLVETGRHLNCGPNPTSSPARKRCGSPTRSCRAGSAAWAAQARICWRCRWCSNCCRC